MTMGRRTGKSMMGAAAHETLSEYIYDTVIAERLGYRDVQIIAEPENIWIGAPRPKVVIKGTSPEGKYGDIERWSTSVDRALTLLVEGEPFVLRVDSEGVWTAVINGKYKGMALTPALAICKAWEERD